MAEQDNQELKSQVTLLTGNSFCKSLKVMVNDDETGRVILNYSLFFVLYPVLQKSSN